MVRGGSTPCCPPLDYLPAKAGRAVNGGRSPFILPVDWLGWLCYFSDKRELSYHKTEYLTFSFNIKFIRHSHLIAIRMEYPVRFAVCLNSLRMRLQIFPYDFGKGRQPSPVHF